MITDPTVALRDELTAALAVLEKQIRGLSDWLLLPISPELRGEMSLELERRSRRRHLILDLLRLFDRIRDGFSNLDADGYPLLPNRRIAGQLISELNEDDADIDTAIALFDAGSPATTIVIDLGNPAEKP